MNANMNYDEIIRRLEGAAAPEAVKWMASYGITPERAYGVKIPELRTIAKECGRNRSLAKRLWANDTRETRILASMIDEPAKVTEKQMDNWALCFDYWEIVDQCCMNLFEKTPFAAAKAVEWSGRPEEYVKRAGFVLMARLAVSDKRAPDSLFEGFLPLIEMESDDDRNMVKKGVNWALRQTGKRNLRLHGKALAASRRIHARGTKSARWIASDALRELESDAVVSRLKSRSGV